MQFAALPQPDASYDVALSACRALSFKGVQDSGLNLYFRPDVAGRCAAGVAQTMLNNIEI
ncbi:hypothetical protein GCM10010840_13610 [Deinococcus aerolatus]|uniref:Uncharacterized protein n=1 Tax=Deinococcus aerolatus TaxID=522487 RepID=A0ABQ2G6E4_9DEIO|nr:hypothetical protein [Deinococcus aerolatus]GGL76887.1 hypothetical protein GCM10010840_13610 [Deinococcus aerolatus]